jgi:hypothetical protein
LLLHRGSWLWFIMIFDFQKPKKQNHMMLWYSTYK